MNELQVLQVTRYRLGTDYLDLYLLHWPARYTPQSNWGQSLQYQQEVELYSSGRASFDEICDAMGDLVAQGKIRGWGMCNDNASGAARLGAVLDTTPMHAGAGRARLCLSHTTTHSLRSNRR